MNEPTTPDAAADAVLIYATAPSMAVARAIADRLVAARSIACANILPGMTSVYHWEGAVRADSEVVLLLKTTAERADAVIAQARALHPYETPAFLILPISGGSRPFLDWVRSACAEPVS